MTGRIYQWVRSIVNNILQKYEKDCVYKPEEMTLQKMHEMRAKYYREVFLPAEKKRLRKEKKRMRKSGLSRSQLEYIDYLNDRGIHFGISGGDKGLRDELERKYRREGSIY